MTKLAVAIMVRSLDQGLSAAARAAEHGADLVEFRIDQFTEAPALITQLVERSALPSIVTCRPTWEGGHYEGDDSARLAAFEAACAGMRKPAYLDIELAAWQRLPQLRQRISALIDHPGQINPTHTGLILSTHDFTTRPADLYQRVEAMLANSACRVIKVAWRARSLRDNVEAFDLIGHRHKPTIALCMGDEGLPSRVLAKKFGALLTFAALEEGEGTAPGQPTLASMKKLYRWDALNADTQVFGVIGHPVGHSMSPAFHNAGFEAIRYNGVYLPMPIPPEWEHFKATIATWLDAKDLDFMGASVTIPHKQNLLRFVEERGGEIEPLARRIGAANTLVVRHADFSPHAQDHGGLYACNTDYGAALDSVCDRLRIERAGLAGKRVAVIGAGGAARAIVAGFAHYGATVVIYNRTFDRATELAKEFNESPTHTGGSAKVVAARLEKLCDSCCHVFINCTSVGMHPNVDETPIPTAADTKGWGPDTVVFDTVYNPLETRLLREAKAAGCITISGAEMFVRQGAAQFKLWTGQEPPIEVMRDVVMKRLGGRV